MNSTRSKSREAGRTDSSLHPDAVAGQDAVAIQPPDYGLDVADRLQAKLKISQPDDPLEREADQVAELVTRMSENAVAMKTPGSVRSLAHRHDSIYTEDDEELQRLALKDKEETLQRASLVEQEDNLLNPPAPPPPLEMEQEEPIQESEAAEAEEFRLPTLLRQVGNDKEPAAARKAEEEEESAARTALPGDIVQTKCDECEERAQRQITKGAATQQTKIPGTAFDTVTAEQAMSRSGAGNPLGRGIQAKMERGFGADFSGVRVHTGTAAQQAARALRARAFTRGPDVFLNAGESASDVRLMAHELTHVVQQHQTFDRAVVRRKPTEETAVFETPVQFPFADLGIPRDAPGRELAIRFEMWRLGISREEAERLWEAVPPDVRNQWNSIPEDVRNEGVLTVSVEVSPEEFALQHEGVEGGEGLLPSGRTERHEERAREFRNLPSKLKKAINAATDQRYWKETRLSGEKIRTGEEGKAETWLRIRDQILAEREFLHYLPERVKRFMSLKSAKEIAPTDYPQLIRIARLIMDMSDVEMNDFLSAATVTHDLNEFENSLKVFVAKTEKGEHGEEREKKGSKYGRYGLIDLPPEIIKVLEAAAEILGNPEELNDLLDLLDEITDLQNITADVVNVLGDPENLLFVALGLLDNPAVASLDTWVFKPVPKGKKPPPRKKKGVKGVLQKIRKALPITKKILKPIFLARRKSMAVQFRASRLIDKLPASVTSVLEKAVGGGADKKIAADIATLSEAIAKQVLTELQEVPKALSKIEATETLELINKEELGRIVAKLTVKLAGGVYGKVASKLGLDDVIADIAKHGTKHTIPDAVVDAINANLTRIITEFKPLIENAGTQVTEILDGIDAVLSKQLKPELLKLVSPKAATPKGAALRGSEADFWSQVAASRGASMERGLYNRMYPVFGRDLGRVAIHTDAAAHDANQSIGSDAMTIGRAVYFRRGEYDDRSREGLGLIAHELTHVIQHAEGAGEDTIHPATTPRWIRKKLAKRLTNRVLRGTGKTKRSIRGGFFIDYGAFDGRGRPMGITARLKKHPKFYKGTKAAKFSDWPPGYKGRAAGHARCHLLAKQLGGSGYQRLNIVTCHHSTLNNTKMKSIENNVRKAVEAGETVIYKVTPLYDKPRAWIPTKIRIVAKGDQGLNYEFTFRNK